MNGKFFIGNFAYFNFSHDYFVRSYLISGDKHEKQIFRGLNPPGSYPPLGFGGTSSMLNRVTPLMRVPKITLMRLIPTPLLDY